MNEILVQIDQVTKVFRSRHAADRRGGTQVRAVDRVSLKVLRGSIFGLVGESGSGKTTLARCLLYLERPTSGSIVFGDQRLEDLSRSALRSLRPKMQIIFQDPNNALNPRISVYRSLAEGLANRGIAGNERSERIRELAELVSIPPENLKRKPRDFSGGQRQRLVIARALSMEPEFLILDEPVSNLDVSIQAQIINLLSDLKQRLDLTYLFISHDLNLVSYLSDTIGVMYEGRIVEVGPTRSVLESPLHGYTRMLLSSSARVHGERISAHRSAAEDRAAADTGCAFRTRCEYHQPGCADSEPTLRDAGGGHMVACVHAGRLKKT